MEHTNLHSPAATTPSPRRRLAAAAAGAALLGSATAQSTRVPEPLPATNPDLKTEVWVAPVKDGVFATDYAQVPPGQRAAELAEYRERLRGMPSGPPDAGPKDFEGPAPNFVPERSSRRTHHQLDQGPDGTLWAYGGTYKASFGPSGASYVPFLGSSAPRNFPVTFRMRDVSVAGEPLAVDLAATPRFDGATAVYDRGAVQERYDTRIGAVEQLFVFDSLPASGDVVVRLEVVSELAQLAAADGLAWGNALGGVTYSSAVAIDAHGRRAAAPTTLEAGVIELRVPAAFVASAVLPLTIDPVLATYVVASDPNDDEFDPDLAYDFTHGRFFIIYEEIFSANDHDIWGEMFTSFGVPLPSTGVFVDFTTNDWRQPKCANNRIDGQFLVAATNFTASPSQVWGRQREADTTSQSAQFQISVGSSGPCRSPDVGGDPSSSSPSHYCVVWEREFSPGVDHDVHARIVTTSATLLGNGPILIDNSGSSLDSVPTISKSCGIEPSSTQNWTVAWNRRFSSTDWDIRGAQVRWDGALTTASFSIDFAGRNDLAPKPSSPLDQVNHARTYLVVYQGLDGADWDIFGAALEGNTVLVRENLSHKWVSGSAQNEFTPVVDSNGHHFAVAYHRNFGTSATDYDVYIAGVYLTQGSLFVSEGPLNLAFSGTFEGNTELCARYSAGLVSDFFGVAWVDYSPTNGGDIEGGLYELPDDFGQSIGSTYCPALPNSSGTFARMRADGAGLVVLTDVRLTAWQLPLNSTLFFATSMTQGFVANPGGSAGNLCLGGAIGRFVGPGQVLNSGAQGQASLQLDLSNHPTPTGSVSVVQGNTWNYQAWFRDTAPGGGSTSNFTDAVALTYR